MSELNKVEVVDSEHSASFLRELSELRKNKRLCDVKLCVGDHQIDCHKCVLSSASLFFKGFFNDASQDSGKDVIDLTDKTNFSVLEAIINYMYSGSISFALVEEAAVLLKTLDYFKMKSMKEKCKTFLMDNINEKNALAMLGVADELYLANLRDASIHCIIENFKKVSCSNDFKELNRNQLESVLEKIGGSNTEIAYLTYLAIVGWVKHETQNRKDFLEELLDYVSEESLSLYHSRKIILNDNFLKNDPGGCKWLARTLFSSNSAVMKKSSPPLFILSHGSSSFCKKFDIYDKLLTTLETRPPFTTGAIAKYKHSIYCLGNVINPETETIVLKYNTIENSWSQLTTNSCRVLIKPVSVLFTTICTKDEKIFLVGVWGDSVKRNCFVCYNLETNVWTSLPDPISFRPRPTVFSYHSSIYLLGEPETLGCCVERYDDREGKWFQECEDFKVPYGYHPSVVISDNVYSLNSMTGQLFKFDPRSSKFDVDNLKSFPGAGQERGYLASIDERLYVANKDGISEYNFHMNEWDEILNTYFEFPILLS